MSTQAIPLSADDSAATVLTAPPASATTAAKVDTTTAHVSTERRLDEYVSVGEKETARESKKSPPAPVAPRTPVATTPAAYQTSTATNNKNICLGDARNWSCPLD